MFSDWAKNSDKNNFNLNGKIVRSRLLNSVQKISEYQVCFSHVPKTGGTSLESILVKNFRPSESIHINAPDLNKLPELINLKKTPAKLICGHHPMHGLLYQLLSKTSLFHCTMLRDPIDRVLSYYNYVKGKTDHPMHQFARDASLPEFLQAAPSPELSNGQTKRFSGQLHLCDMSDNEMFHQAQNCLKTCFSLVMTTCFFDESMLLLKHRLGLKDIFYRRNNVSKRFLTRQQLNDDDLNLIHCMNQEDIKLFNWAKAQLQKLINTELTQTDLQTFKANNSTWKKLIQL